MSKKMKIAVDTTENVSKEDWIKFAKDNPIDPAVVQHLESNEILMPDLLEESKRSDRFFGMRLNGKSIDDIENKFLAMFAEFIVLMALFISMLGFAYYYGQSLEVNNMENTIKTSAPSITSSAMLVEYNASVWTGRKLDKNASQELEMVKRTDPNVANVHKKLLGNCPELSCSTVRWQRT